jgi:N-acetylglucosamine kinase-like BadF-type ATPase
LRLQEVTTGRVVFAGNFTQTVSSWAEQGDVVYERVAKDFAKALKKRIAKLQKQAAAKSEKS